MREFLEFRALERMIAIGERGMDMRFAAAFARLASMTADAKGPFYFRDFMPFCKQEKPAEATPQECAEAMASWLSK